MVELAVWQCSCFWAIYTPWATTKLYFLKKSDNHWFSSLDLCGSFLGSVVGVLSGVNRHLHTSPHWRSQNSFGKQVDKEEAPLGSVLMESQKKTRCDQGSSCLMDKAAYGGPFVEWKIKEKKGYIFLFVKKNSKFEITVLDFYLAIPLQTTSLCR